MSKAKGIYSYSKNPMSQPSRTSSTFGPGSNPDQKKANKLLQQAHMEKESIRGKSGM